MKQYKYEYTDTYDNLNNYTGREKSLVESPDGNLIELDKDEQVIKWNKVKDVLPEPNMYSCLVRNDNGVCYDEREPVVAFLEGKDMKWYMPWIDKEVKVTHWAELPEIKE